MATEMIEEKNIFTFIISYLILLPNGATENITLLLCIKRVNHFVIDVNSVCFPPPSHCNHVSAYLILFAFFMYFYFTPIFRIPLLLHKQNEIKLNGGHVTGVRATIRGNGVKCGAC